LFFDDYLVDQEINQPSLDFTGAGDNNSHNTVASGMYIVYVETH